MMALKTTVSKNHRKSALHLEAVGHQAVEERPEGMQLDSLMEHHALWLVRSDDPGSRKPRRFSRNGALCEPTRLDKLRA